MPLNQRNSEIGHIQDQIFGNKRESSLIEEYHYFMIHYGYIPFEDFKKMPAHIVNDLIILLNKMNESNQNSIPQGRKGRLR